MSDGARRRRALGLALTLALVISGCEHTVSLRGQVTVPVEIQRQFSREAPGLLLFGGGAGQPSLGADVLAVLCDPGEQPLVVPLRQERLDCAHQGTVWFRLTRMAPADKDALPCGIKQQNLDALVNAGRLSSASLDKLVASASVTVFAGQGGSCRSGEQDIDATLTAAP